MEILIPGWRRVVQAFAPVLLFARQELVQRYRGSLLGAFWLVAQPLTLVLVFSVVFSELMGARMSPTSGKYAYSVYLIAGMLMWNAQSSILMQLTQVYQAKSGLISKTRLSLLSMPLYVPLVEAAIWLVGMVFFGVFLLSIGQARWAHLWQLPLIAVLCFSWAYLAGLILGMLGVFIPDIRTGIPVVMQILFWATPIVYVPGLLPAWAAGLQDWNILYWGPSQAQAVLSGDGSLSPAMLGAMLAASLVLAALVAYMGPRLERDIRDLI